MLSNMRSRVRLDEVVFVSLAALAVVWLGRVNELALVAVAAAIAAVLLLPFARGALLCFFALVLGLCTLLSQHPVALGPVKLYGADGILYFFAIAFLYVVLGRSRYLRARLKLTERRYAGVVAAFGAYGLVALAYGLLVGRHAVNDAFGDYRRLFFYPMALLIPLALPLQPRHLNALKNVVLAGAGLVVLVSLYRLATGATYRPDIFIVRATEPSPRLLSYTETVTLTIALAYLVAALRGGHFGPRKAALLIFAAVCAIFLVLSGWRMALLYGFAAPVAALALMALVRGERWQGLLRGLALLGVVALAAGIIAAAIMPGEVARSAERFAQRMAEFNVRQDQRFYTWRQALREFGQSPVFGTGLGDQMVVYLRASDGQFIAKHGSTHNTFLAVLYQTGLPGFLLFALVHACFVRRMLARLRRMPPQWQALAVGMFVGYACALGVSVLQPLEVAGIVSLYLMMGFMLTLVSKYAAPPPHDAAEAEYAEARNA